MYYFNTPEEAEHADKGQRLKLNGTVDLSKDISSLDPRVIENFNVNRMRYKTSLQDRTLTIAGELEFKGKRTGAVTQSAEILQIRMSPTFSECSVIGFSLDRSVVEGNSSVIINHTFSRQLTCSIAPRS